ncbi:MAG: hypothetical protein RID81_47190 [Sandaracinaceae bacterium]
MRSPSRERLAGALFAAALLVACGEASVAAPDVPDAPPEREAEPAVALLDEAQGDVRFSAAGVATWAPTARGRSLRAADAIQTMEDGRAGIRFHRDGSTVRLAPMTTLRVPEQPPRVTRLRHLSGRMVARLDPSAENARLEVALPPGDLVIETEQGAGEDAYVEAQVEVDRGHTEIALLHGRARLQRSVGAPVEIEENSFVSVAPDGEILDEGASIPAPALTVPEDGATVRTRQSTTLRWEPVDDAESYRVFVARGEEDTETHSVVEPSLPLTAPSGPLRWWVRGVRGDAAGRASDARTLTLDVDRIPPALSLSRPTPSAVVHGPRVTISGATDVGALVDINGQPAEVGGDGRFEATQAVPLGLTNVVVRVTDDLGNSRVMTRPVLRDR